MIRQLVLGVAMSGALALSVPALALAANPHSGTTGQPSQSCQNPSTPTTPGNASGASGSAFNPNGTAGGVYAGNQPQSQKNPKSVAQYDVACFQNSQSH
jgi:hypothetical protein